MSFSTNENNTHVCCDDYLAISFLFFYFRVKKISALYIEKSKEQLLVGTEGGNVYSVDLRTFTLLDDHIIYQDVAMQK